MRLRYADTLTMDPSTGSYATFSYRANGIYDPQVTSGGHQPCGFDRWKLIYQHYVVIGSKVTATFHVNSISSSNPSYVGIKLVTEPGVDGLAQIFAAGGTTISALQEQPLNNTYRTLVGGTTPGQNVSKRVRHKFSMRKCFPGCSLATAKLQGSAVKDPDEQVYYELYALAPSVTSNPGPLHVNVIIDYLVVFFEKLPSLAS